MSPNDLLLAHLSAQSSDGAVAQALAGAALGLAGEIGKEGFGATTLEGHMVAFTHPEFRLVAGLPANLDAVEATVQQVAEYARATGLAGIVLNPGTHQRFLSLSLVQEEAAEPEPPNVPTLGPSQDADLQRLVEAAAPGSGVEAVWLAEGPVVVASPRPDAAFEAALRGRGFRGRSYAGSPDWTPVLTQEPTLSATVRFAPLSEPLPAAFAADLARHARIHRLKELWAFEAEIGEEKGLALAFSPHPQDAFVRDFDVLHARHGVRATVSLLNAATLREVLPKMGRRLA